MLTILAKVAKELLRYSPQIVVNSAIAAILMWGEWPFFSSVVRIDLGWVRWWMLFLAFVACLVWRKWKIRKDARDRALQEAGELNRRIS